MNRIALSKTSLGVITLGIVALAGLILQKITQSSFAFAGNGPVAIACYENERSTDTSVFFDSCAGTF